MFTVRRQIERKSDVFIRFISRRNARKRSEGAIKFTSSSVTTAVKRVKRRHCPHRPRDALIIHRSSPSHLTACVLISLFAETIEARTIAVRGRKAWADIAGAATAHSPAHYIIAPGEILLSRISPGCIVERRATGIRAIRHRSIIPRFLSRRARKVRARNNNAA